MVIVMEEKGRSKKDTVNALHAVAAEMHDRMMRGEPPRITLPVRSKKNIAFDEKLNVYKYGKKKTIRDATSLGSAHQLLRALHVTEFMEDMIESKKSSTLREMN